MAVNGSRMYVVKRGKFRFARQAVHIKRNGALLGMSARLKEINGALYSSAYQCSLKVAHSRQCLFLCLLGTQ